MVASCEIIRAKESIIEINYLKTFNEFNVGVLIHKIKSYLLQWDFCLIFQFSPLKKKNELFYDLIYSFILFSVKNKGKTMISVILCYYIFDPLYLNHTC